jgi:predicted DsbA family dithiol-disulfide isomerase
MSEPVRLQLFHDALCAWCAVAVERVFALERDFGDLLSVTLRPFPLRPDEQLVGRPEAAKVSRHLKRAAREPEGQGMVADLWQGDDRPLSSMPPLIALEAALVQGRDAQRAFLRKLHENALKRGINVARRDVLFELASTVGLDVPRFALAFDSSATARAVELSHREALGRGVRAIPAIAVGEDWLLTGARPLCEYREVVRGWMQQHRDHPRARVIH